MAGVTLGFLKFVLGFDSVSFKKGTTEAEAELKKLQKSFERTGKQMSGIGQAMSLAITTPLLGIAAVGIKEAQDTQKAMAQVNAALSSMGPVAGKTAEQLQNAANAFEGASLFEADEILTKVTANLLTFGNIAGATFDKAQQAALDLATRMGTDLQSATVLIGKALNDPVAGLASLTRVGIQFTEQQKEQIKAMTEAGNAAGAQAIILGELNRQFGGAAKAAQDADQFNVLSDSFKSIAESIGTLLLPLIAPLAAALKSVADTFSSMSPTGQKVVIMFGALVAAAGPTLVVAGKITSAFGTILPVLGKVGPAFTVLKTAMLAARAAALTTLPALVPFLVPLAAIAAAVGAAYLAWKNWDKIEPIVRKMVAGVSGWLQRLATPFKWVIDKLSVIGKAFFTLYDKVVGHSYIPDMVDGIQAEMARLDKVMVQPAIGAVSKTAEAFRNLQQSTASLLNELFPEQAAANEGAAKLALLEQAAAKGVISVDLLAKAIRRLSDKMAGLPDSSLPSFVNDNAFNDNEMPGGDIEELRSILDGIRPAFADATGGLIDDTAATRSRVIEEFGQMAAGAIGSVKSMANAFKSGDILSATQGLLDLLGQVFKLLGSVGVKIPGFSPVAGARAAGGPVVPGKTYLVGERGPEFITPKRSGYVHPNGSDMGDGGMTVKVVKGDLFDVIVDRRATRVAAPIGARSAVAGAAGGRDAINRQVARSFP